MEKMDFEFSTDYPRKLKGSAVVVGVVSSGNLEVLVEEHELGGRCKFNISTSVKGHKKTWHEVLRSFADRRGASDLLFSINDMGATPAVVTLRLDQALNEFCVE